MKYRRGDWVVATETLKNGYDVPVEPGEAGVITNASKGHGIYRVEFDLRFCGFICEEEQITIMQNIEHSLEES
jgi:hypothetical protein